jgi:hypothetical protein
MPRGGPVGPPLVRLQDLDGLSESHLAADRQMMLADRSNSACRATLGGIAASASALLVALLLAFIFATPNAVAAPASLEDASVDGETAFFSTTDQLVPGDTDTRADIYERSYDGVLERYVTRQISVGPIGGNDAFPSFFNGATADGGEAFFSTGEALVAEDRDRSEDVYMRDLGSNVTILVSAGDPSCTTASCGQREVDSVFAPSGVVASGGLLFFRSVEQLSSADSDESLDVYLRDIGDGTTTLVSAADPGCSGEGCGTGPFAAVFRGASADGMQAFLATDERLVDADADALLDIYRRDLINGVTALVSVPGTCPAAIDCSASYGDASSDGSHVYFETAERLGGEDDDSVQDVYSWADGIVTLVSLDPNGGDEPEAATFAGASDDGSSVYFETTESLVSSDTDEAKDVYQRSGGTTTLVSTGSTGGNADSAAQLQWVSPDGSSAAVLFSSGEQLTSGDIDSMQDLYRRVGGTTTLLSTGPAGGNGAFNAGFAGASNDGSRVFVITAEGLVSADTDGGADVYEISGGSTTLVSTGPLAGKSATPAGLPADGVAADGSHVFFTTEERVTEGDLDAETDVYDRFAGGTLLVSTGNSAPLGPPTPAQLSTNPASPGASLTPSVKGQSDPNTAIKIYSTSDCSGAPIATGTWVAFGGAGISVSVAAGSTTSLRATATDLSGDTSPCSAAVTYTQQSSTPPPPPPPPPAEGGGGGTGSSGSGSGGTGVQGGSGGKTGGKQSVVHVTPHTRITFGPAAKTRSRRPVFRFADSTGQEGSTFSCKVDRERWRLCASPIKLKSLKAGRHVFQVKAVNAVGTPEPAAVKRSFKVVGR